MKNRTSVLNARGFTLVELVTVVVLLGIVLVTVTPRFFSRDGFGDYAARDQIIAAARLAQQRAMYDHSANACYRLHINNNVIAAQRLDGANYVNIGPTKEWLDGIVIDSASVNNSTVYFDGLGNPLSSNVADCAGAITQADIAINGSSGLSVRINTSGYVQAQP